MDANVRGCFSSVDGSDYKIREPRPFDVMCYSLKIRGPGLRYEIAISVRSGWLIWTNGAYPCGEVSDLKIFKQKLKHALIYDERIIADGTYRDELCLPNDFSLPKDSNRLLKTVRARHETANRRLKQFGCLNQRFRHRQS